MRTFPILTLLVMWADTSNLLLSKERTSPLLTAHGGSIARQRQLMVGSILVIPTATNILTTITNTGSTPKERIHLATAHPPLPKQSPLRPPQVHRRIRRGLLRRHHRPPIGRHFRHHRLGDAAQYLPPLVFVDLHILSRFHSMGLTIAFVFIDVVNDGVGIVIPPKRQGQAGLAARMVAQHLRVLPDLHGMEGQFVPSHLGLALFFSRWLVGVGG
mmetsp:Transcript_13343/g.38078  ORF Transcript_13343/g.38078 Transcript_13343/m.38078 type:complete len:215 (+) Transcript_13343:219-863(+)